MDFIKDWFFTQSISILHWIILAVSAGALSLIWIALEKIETSKLGTFLRTILCIPAIILGWSFLGGQLLADKLHEDSYLNGEFPLSL